MRNIKYVESGRLDEECRQRASFLGGSKTVGLKGCSGHDRTVLNV